MRLAEVDGKALLRRHGIAVPRSVLLRPGENPPDDTAGWPGFILKAQVLEGGRGKSGLVRRFAKATGFRDARRLILATLDDADTPLLLEQAVPIAREIFIAVRIDGTRQRLERDPRRFSRRSPSSFRANWRHGCRATRRGCPTSPGRKTWSCSRSIHWRSPRTATSSPAMQKSFATRPPISAMTRTSFPRAAGSPNAR
jgi:hypothetical protein